MIIRHANLRIKQLSEKFVSIRKLLQGYVRPVMPSQRVLMAIEEDYTAVARAWEREPALRGGRNNIINLNLIIANLALRHGGQRLYDAHIDDFYQLSERKWTELFRLYTNIAVQRVGFIPACPVTAILK